MTMFGKRGIRTVIAAGTLCVFGALSAGAQDAGGFAQKLADLKKDLEGSTQNAQSAVENGEYGSAAVEFDYAAQYSRQLRIYSLAQFLPEAQSGYVAQDPEASEPSAQGGGYAAGYGQNPLPLNSVRREYVKGGDKVSVTITADATNQAQQYTNMINNPAQLNQQQYSTERVHGQRVLVQTAQVYPGQNNAGANNVTVYLPYNGIYMITGVGPKEAILAHMGALDFQGLATAR